VKPKTGQPGRHGWFPWPDEAAEQEGELTRRERLERRLEKRETWAGSASSKSATEFQKAHTALDGMTGEPIH
jgi:hypothetical protein